MIEKMGFHHTLSELACKVCESYGALSIQCICNPLGVTNTQEIGWDRATVKI